MNRKKARYLKTYLAFFIPIITLPMLFSVAYYLKEKNHCAVLLEKKESLYIEKQQTLIERKICSIVSDLKFLASHQELPKALNPSGKGDRQALALEFLQFCKYKDIFDQVRILDLAGREMVRVNYNNGKMATVTADQLQDKSRRYYFPDTIRLEENEIFISPFDLNIENGEIEKPLKPMIRFSTPIFDPEKKKVGIVILNYLGSDMLDDLESKQGKIMLANSQGFWLKGLHPDDEWGFMYGKNGTKNMEFRFPDAWRQIRESDSGQFYTGKGLFTYTTIRPVFTGMKSSLGSIGAYVGGSTPEVAADDYYWKLIAWVSPESISAKNHELLKDIGLINGCLILLLATGCFFLTREFRKRKEADLNLKQTRATLQSVFNSVIPICVTNFDYKMLLTNGEYIKTFIKSGDSPAEFPERCFQSRPSPICKTEACPLLRIANGEEEVNFETTRINADKSFQHFIVTARPLYNAEGIPVGIVESFQDITERDRLEKERSRLLTELQESLRKVKTLSGFLPICASCKKIRDDKGYWNQIESYIQTHSNAEFSHGICPDCVKELYPEQYKKIFPEQDKD